MYSEKGFSDASRLSRFHLIGAQFADLRMRPEERHKSKEHPELMRKRILQRVFRENRELSPVDEKRRPSHWRTHYIISTARSSERSRSFCSWVPIVTRIHSANP